MSSVSLPLYFLWRYSTYFLSFFSHHTHRNFLHLSCSLSSISFSPFVWTTGPDLSCYSSQGNQVDKGLVKMCDRTERRGLIVIFSVPSIIASWERGMKGEMKSSFQSQGWNEYKSRELRNVCEGVKREKNKEGNKCCFFTSEILSLSLRSIPVPYLFLSSSICMFHWLCRWSPILNLHLAINIIFIISNSHLKYKLSFFYRLMLPSITPLYPFLCAWRFGHEQLFHHFPPPILCLVIVHKAPLFSL